MEPENDFNLGRQYILHLMSKALVQSSDPMTFGIKCMNILRKELWNEQQCSTEGKDRDHYPAKTIRKC